MTFAKPSALATLAVLSLCSSALAAVDSPQSLSLAAAELNQQDRPATGYIVLPQSYADENAAADEQQTTTTFALAEPLPIFLNRWGGTYSAGNDNSAQNVSSVVDSGTATISGFSGSDSQWNNILTCVQDQFAQFNTYVTDVEPAGGEYIEAVIGGTPGQVNLPNGVGGVAPYDPFGCNIIPRAVVYAFSDVYGNNAQAICETATQEIAHALTLDHVLLCEDPMTYLSGCGAKTFQDETASCGENSPRECACSEGGQNSVQMLFDILGPNEGVEVPEPVVDNGPPSVVITSPTTGSTFIPETQVAITATITDDTQIVEASLYWANNDIFLPCPGEGGGWSCAKNGDTYTWLVAPAEGTRSFYAYARDQGGNTAQSSEVTIVMTNDVDPDQPPPEQDTTSPEVAIASPADGAVFATNGQVEVVATATDDTALSEVALIWSYPEGVIQAGCPYESQAITCDVSGSTYVWTVNVGVGTRTFSVYAEDIFGNQAQTSERTISLSDNPPTEPDDDIYEENDTWDLATPVACGDTLSLITNPGDDDWFALETAPDTGFRIAIGGSAAAGLTVSASTGPQAGGVFAEENGVDMLEVAPPTNDVRIRVRPDATMSGEYMLMVNCVPLSDLTTPDPGTGSPGGNDNSTPVDDADPGAVDDDGEGPANGGASFNGGLGCAQSSTSDSAGLALVLVGLALARRRRRP